MYILQLIHILILRSSSEPAPLLAFLPCGVTPSPLLSQDFINSFLLLLIARLLFCIFFPYIVLTFAALAPAAPEDCRLYHSANCRLCHSAIPAVLQLCHSADSISKKNFNALLGLLHSPSTSTPLHSSLRPHSPPSPSLFHSLFPIPYPTHCYILPLAARTALPSLAPSFALQHSVIFNIQRSVILDINTPLTIHTTV